MLRVYYSNRTEELLSALAERVVEVRDSGPASCFEPLPLVVPNRNMETFVKLELARRLGISWNVETRFLADFLRHATGRPSDETKLLDRLLTLLFDDRLLARLDLEPVRSYLFGAGDEPSGRELRRVQLARKLAGLFAEYERSRPELLECWRAGLFLGEPDLLGVEAWQRRLWLETVGPRVATELEGAGSSSPPGPAAHLFGISYLARSQVVALGRLARERSVFVYSLNPCQEIWEAVVAPLPADTTRSSPRRYERRGSDLGPGEVFSVENPFRLSNPGEMLPLRLWGRPGREGLRLLNALTGCELVSRVEEPSGSGLLHQIQRDIAARRPARSSIPEDFDFADDETIAFFECTSRRRELETVAAEIWSLLSRSETSPGEEPLRFNDIAVLLPPSQAPRYQALVGSVFREARGIPHNIVDLPLAGESRIAEAVELLLEIPLGGFTRSSVLRFATHPVVLASFPEASASEWLSWSDALGILRGADRRDLESGYLERDVLHWDQGLVRLALGAFLEGAEDGDEPEKLYRPRPGLEDAYLPEEIPRESRESAGSFGLLLRSLLADAKEASRAHMTVPAWMEFLSAFVTTYVEPRSAADERVLRKCLRVVSQMGRVELGSRKVSYRVAHELVRRDLRSATGARGQYLLDGVVVSSFLPMRAIPFRVIFILGLSEGSYPARDSSDQLDLRRAHRRAGDVGAGDRDRYLFLETLLCARDRLVLSRLSQDEVTGEALAPSPLITELRSTLLRGYVGEHALRVRKPPRERSDDPRARKVFPEAAREKKAAALGEHLRAHLGVHRLPHLASFRESLPPIVQRALACPSLPPPLPRSERPLSVFLSTLTRFLECPLQGSARVHLGLRREEDGRSLEDDEERYRAEPLDRAVLLTEAFRRGGGNDAYDEVARCYEARGRIATGILGASERSRDLQVLASWREALLGFTNGRRHAWLQEEPRAPLRLSVGKRIVELHRPSELRLSSPKALLRLLAREPNRFHPLRESLRGFLDHVYQCASTGTTEPSTFVAVNAPSRGEVRLTAFRFAPVDGSEARSYLEGLLSDLLAGVHEYLLPCEAVFAESSPPPLARTSSAFGPVPHPEDYPCLEDEARRETVERRFGLYFRTLVPETLS